MKIIRNIKKETVNTNFKDQYYNGSLRIEKINNIKVYPLGYQFTTGVIINNLLAKQYYNQYVIL